MPPTPPSADILPYKATETTLANGLKVIVVPTGFPNIVSIQIPVQTGSRNEVEPGKSGFAHFFEHMMFRGTKRFSSDRYQEVVSRTGARQNAYTTDDYTNYHTTFAKEDLETLLDIEADRFMNLEYSEEGFKTEARAVLGEYNKNSADPLTKLIEVQRENAYTTHTYRHTTMGFVADIENMPNQFDYSRAFFDRWYRPEYTTVIVAGDVEPDAVVKLVEKYWSEWKVGGGTTITIPPEPPHTAPVVVHVPWSSPTLPWVTVGFHAPAFSAVEKDYAALDTLLDLSFGETSDLYQRLVEREQVVDEFFPYLPSCTDPGLATIMARLKRPEDSIMVRDAICETIAKLRNEPVAEERLEDAKSHARYAFARTLDNSESIAATLARFARFERRYDTLNELFRITATLTPTDLQTAATRYLSDENMVITTLASEALPAEIQEPPTVAPPAPEEPAKPVTIPELIQASPSPLVRVKLLFAAGSAHDPNGKDGLATLAAEMIASAGSKRMPIDEINRALFPMAASFSAQVDKEMTTFTGVVHRENAARFAEIALAQLLEPGFREDDFNRLKAQQLNQLEQDLRSNNEEELAKERLQTTIFARGPYDHTTLGTVRGIRAITLDDVKEFAASAYSQANLTLGATGDIPSEFLDRLRDDLRTLPAGEPLPAPKVKARQPKGIELEIIEKDTRATAISLGHPIAVRRGHPDFISLWLARAWLGEHRASFGRLFQRLREVRGLNYGDYAYIEAFPRGMYQFFPDANIARQAQIFEIWIRPVAPEHGAFALKAALYELDRLITDGLTAEEFASTREYLEKNVFIMTKTQDQQLGYALDSRWYGIPDFPTYAREALASLTVEDVNAAIRRHLSAQNLNVVIITKDVEKLRDELLADHRARIHYDAAKPEDLLAEDEVIGSRKLHLWPESVRITPIHEVFAR
jgi:zinc protease